MNELFGIPMSSVLVALLLGLSLAVLVVAWIAWRRRVIFKLGIRNLLRRKAQTVLIVVGLMLSTLTISASLGTDDTMQHSVSAGIYDVDAIAPMLLERVPVMNETSRQSEPTVTLAGVDPATLGDEANAGWDVRVDVSSANPIDDLEQSQSSGFLYIMQGFMGLGLIVGVAAVGVIAFRSVVERRQQIGVLRALGYRRGMVALSFMIESGFVVALGIISGAAAGLFLAYNLMHSESFGGSDDMSVVVPWNLLAVIIAATVVASLLMTWLPARQAAGIAPAEALRYE